MLWGVICMESNLLLCYQVVGLPKPRRNHAVVMAKFAEEILRAMRVATSDLDSQLGPGTADLAIRIGVSFVTTHNKVSTIQQSNSV
jgi:hypothetical protein